MHNISVPIVIKIPSQPDIADTPGQTVANQKHRYFGRNTRSLGIVWADRSSPTSAKAVAPASCTRRQP